METLKTSPLYPGATKDQHPSLPSSHSHSYPSIPIKTELPVPRVMGLRGTLISPTNSPQSPLQKDDANQWITFSTTSNPSITPTIQLSHAHQHSTVESIPLRTSVPCSPAVRNILPPSRPRSSGQMRGSLRETRDSLHSTDRIVAPSLIHRPIERTRNPSPVRDGQVLSVRSTRRKEKIKTKRIVEEIIEKEYKYGELEKEEKEIYEDVTKKIREITIEKVQQRVTTVEVPEYEYVEKTIEVPEVKVIERIVEHPVYREVERIVGTPKHIEVERLEEYPVVEERVVEVIKEEYYVVEEVVERIVEVPKTQFIDVPMPEVIDVYDCHEIDLCFPVPVHQTVDVTLTLPSIKSKYVQKETAFFYPRFVEVPIPEDLLDDQTLEQCESIFSKIDALRSVLNDDAFNSIVTAQAQACDTTRPTLRAPATAPISSVETSKRQSEPIATIIRLPAVIRSPKPSHTPQDTPVIPKEVVHSTFDATKPSEVHTGCDPSSRDFTSDRDPSLYSDFTATGVTHPLPLQALMNLASLNGSTLAMAGSARNLHGSMDRTTYTATESTTVELTPMMAMESSRGSKGLTLSSPQFSSPRGSATQPNTIPEPTSEEEVFSTTTSDDYRMTLSSEEEVVALQPIMHNGNSCP